MSVVGGVLACTELGAVVALAAGEPPVRRARLIDALLDTMSEQIAALARRLCIRTGRPDQDAALGLVRSVAARLLWHAQPGSVETDPTALWALVTAECFRQPVNPTPQRANRRALSQLLADDPAPPYVAHVTPAT